MKRGREKMIDMGLDIGIRDIILRINEVKGGFGESDLPAMLRNVMQRGVG